MSDSRAQPFNYDIPLLFLGFIFLENKNFGLDPIRVLPGFIILENLYSNFLSKKNKKVGKVFNHQASIILEPFMNISRKLIWHL